ncbi:MAG: GvpL/GvpF family gas vesicle protein [Pseudomonadota bacterium]
MTRLRYAVHGVVSAATPPPADAAPHLRVTSEGLALLYSPLPAEDLRVARPDLSADPPDAAALAEEAEAALHHNAVLSAYAASHDVLPARFGGAVSGKAAARALLSDHAAVYRAGLEGIAGASEYGLKVRPAHPKPVIQRDDSASTGGRHYLARRREVRDARYRDAHAQRDALTELEASLHPLCRAWRPMAAGTNTLVAHALLVDRRSAAALIAVAEREHARLLGLNLALELSGPWPAYSFADGTGATTPAAGSWDPSEGRL